MLCICRSRLALLASKSKSAANDIKRRTLAGKEVRKFYKNATITQGEGGYEVNLDQRKLKTPLGSVFRVSYEPLAKAVVTEWTAQKDTIKQQTMHLTSFCNTAIDNPMRTTRETRIQSILEFLDTDTLCYRVDHPEECAELQHQLWQPVVDWVCEWYDIEINATTGIGVPPVPPQTREIFHKHLDSFGDWALIGYWQAVESLKSMILTTALVDRHLSVTEAVRLSRLEQEFQISKWGNVEWAHDVDLLEVQSRVAAAVLFVHLTSTQSSTVAKKIS